jgi:hypothetical protein
MFRGLKQSLSKGARHALATTTEGRCGRSDRRMGHDRCQPMMNQMMGHMGEHMGMGMDGEGRGMMMQCPMMQMHGQDDDRARPGQRQGMRPGMLGMRRGQQ